MARWFSSRAEILSIENVILKAAKQGRLDSHMPPKVLRGADRKNYSATRLTIVFSQAADVAKTGSL